METKKWEAMLTAVELGSFTRAAARLGVTQSGLTHMMKALERETGLSLLLRDRYGVRPTAAGEQLLPAVRDLLQAAGRLEGQIAAQSGQRRENIRVAAYSSICMHWLPTIVQQFRWAWPDVSVDIRMGSVAEIFRWLQEGKVDLSFASRQDQGRYDWVPLWDDPLLAILPPDWPLGGAERFPVSAFSGREFLMPSLGFDLDILEVFETQNVRPDIRSNTAVEDAAILSMVEHGLGVSVLSQLVLQGRRDNVLALPLDPPACRRIGIAVPSLEEAPGHVRRFIEYSQRIVGALHGAPDSSPQH
jgi:DNA-binding transcriptional LysR family regulator